MLKYVRRALFEDRDELDRGGKRSSKIRCNVAGIWNMHHFSSTPLSVKEVEEVVKLEINFFSQCIDRNC